MSFKDKHRPRPETKSMHPRSQVVSNKNPFRPQFNVDIFSRLWPPPRKTK